VAYPIGPCDPPTHPVRGTQLAPGTGLPHVKRLISWRGWPSLQYGTIPARSASTAMNSET